MLTLVQLKIYIKEGKIRSLGAWRQLKLYCNTGQFGAAQKLLQVYFARLSTFLISVTHLVYCMTMLNQCHISMKWHQINTYKKIPNLFSCSFIFCLFCFPFQTGENYAVYVDIQRSLSMRNSDWYQRELHGVSRSSTAESRFLVTDFKVFKHQ